VIERLNKEMSECKRTAQEDLVKLVSEHECQIKSLQFDHQKLLSEKVMICDDDYINKPERLNAWEIPSLKT
jgi:hypothetical protein